MFYGTITQERVKKLFDYDPETGILTRKVPTQRSPIGSQVKTKSNGGIVVNIGRQSFPVHYIIWLWVNGVYVHEEKIEHINGIRDDNRLKNLQLKRSKNSRRKPNRKSGITGIDWHEHSNKWRARITVNYKEIYLGAYEQINDAVTARKNAEMYNSSEQ